ncbi:hypothetical protein GCM10009734_71580 [Nonomuraea bangladeshensis]
MKETGQGGSRDREDQEQGRAEPEPYPGQAGGVRHDVLGAPGPLADRGGDLVADREAHAQGKDDEGDRLIEGTHINRLSPHTSKNGDNSELGGKINGPGHEKGNSEAGDGPPYLPSFVRD